MARATTEDMISEDDEATYRINGLQDILGIIKYGYAGTLYGHHIISTDLVVWMSEFDEEFNEQNNRQFYCSLPNYDYNCVGKALPHSRYDVRDMLPQLEYLFDNGLI